MILQQLYADADAIYESVTGHDLPPPMFDEEVVHWIVPLDRDGNFAGEMIWIDTRHEVPHNYGRSSDVVPNLLVDTAGYALGILDNNAAKKHAAFKDLLRGCVEKTKDPLAGAVLAFLDASGLPEGKVPKNLKCDATGKHRIAFTVNGAWPTNSPAVRDYWDDLTRRQCKGVDKQQGHCLVSDQPGPVESVLSCDISIGGESAPLISMNEASANSYGFSQALNGAVSRDAAERFTKALRTLMRGKQTSLRVSELTYVYWTRRGADEDVNACLEAPNTDLLDKLMKRGLFAGERVVSPAPEQFYALALSGNKTRVVFRDWLKTTLPEAKRNLTRWLKAQEIVDAATGEGEVLFGINRLAKSLYRQVPGKPPPKIPARVTRALLRTALHGDALPPDLLAKAVTRCRAAHQVSDARAALMKAALAARKENETTMSAGLDETNADPPYVCGRLLAVLDNIQYRALGKVNVTVVDRYFSAATATPQTVLTTLVKRAKKAHLPKIRRAIGWGACQREEGAIENLLGLLSPGSTAENPAMEAMPASLGPDGQAIFLLGYYHQRARYTKERNERIAEAQRLKAAKPTEPKKEN